MKEKKEEKEKSGFEQVSIGEERIFSKTVSEADIVLFSGVSGDFNPLHVNEEYGKKTLFGSRVAHGLLTASFISTALARFPPTVILLSLRINFKKPVRIGDTITAKARVKEKIKEKKKVVLDVSCVNQKNEEVIQGETTIMIV